MAASGVLLRIGTVELFEQGNLLGHGELFSTTVGAAQTETAALIGAPLALAAVRAGMFLVRGFHFYSVRCPYPVGQARVLRAGGCAADTGSLPRRVLQRAAGK